MQQILLCESFSSLKLNIWVIISGAACLKENYSDFAGLVKSSAQKPGEFKSFPDAILSIWFILLLLFPIDKNTASLLVNCESRVKDK